MDVARKRLCNWSTNSKCHPWLPDNRRSSPNLRLALRRATVPSSQESLHNLQCYGSDARRPTAGRFPWSPTAAHRNKSPSARLVQKHTWDKRSRRHAATSARSPTDHSGTPPSTDHCSHNSQPIGRLALLAGPSPRQVPDGSADAKHVGSGY